MKFPPTHHLVGYLTFLLLFFYLMPAQRNIDPTLKVEMPKSQQQKKRREKVLLRRTSGGFSGRGGALSGRGGGGAGRGGGGGGSGRKSEGNLNKLREEEASAIAALHYGRKVRHCPYRLGGRWFWIILGSGFLSSTSSSRWGLWRPRQLECRQSWGTNTCNVNMCLCR